MLNMSWLDRWTHRHLVQRVSSNDEMNNRDWGRWCWSCFFFSLNPLFLWNEIHFCLPVALTKPLHSVEGREVLTNQGQWKSLSDNTRCFGFCLSQITVFIGFIWLLQVSICVSEPNSSFQGVQDTEENRNILVFLVWLRSESCPEPSKLWQWIQHVNDGIINWDLSFLCESVYLYII
jgi:hypothetical protein